VPTEGREGGVEHRVRTACTYVYANVFQGLDFAVPKHPKSSFEAGEDCKLCRDREETDYHSIVSSFVMSLLTMRRIGKSANRYEGHGGRLKKGRDRNNSAPNCLQVQPLSTVEVGALGKEEIDTTCIDKVGRNM
jgi:hypothetical protein